MNRCDSGIIRSNDTKCTGARENGSPCGRYNRNRRRDNIWNRIADICRYTQGCTGIIYGIKRFSRNNMGPVSQCSRIEKQAIGIHGTSPNSTAPHGYVIDKEHDTRSTYIVGCGRTKPYHPGKRAICDGLNYRDNRCYGIKYNPSGCGPSSCSSPRGRGSRSGCATTARPCSSKG